ncbi:MAG: hemolysin III family protein [Actinomycetota bacterium]
MIETTKPTWRGRMHQIAFFVAIPAGVTLVTLAHSASARVAAAIYAASLVGLYGSSAAYHRIHWSPRNLLRMKRLDHAMIFVLIAGSYTPLSLLVLHRPWSVVVLSTVWGIGLVGVALKLFRIDRLSALTGGLYIGLGWMAVLVLPLLLAHMSAATTALLFAGGALYTGGAVVLARNKPNPRPLVFGYHEIWHTMVIGASACHYTMILLITRTAH